MPALLFLALTAVRLDAQGLEYDELFQAPGAFAWAGTPVSSIPFLVFFSVRGVPVLNMSYTGALKSALYGLYLRATGAGFGVLSWRLTALLLIAAGLVAFFVLAARRVPSWALAIPAVLILSDVQLLLSARYDWGPVALALLLRLLLLVCWIQAEETGSAAALLGAGVLVGVATFEKLSGVVLLIPLALLLLSHPCRRTPRRLAITAIGFLAGASPLALANLLSFRRTHHLVSLSDVSGPAKTAGDLLRLGWTNLALAPGERVRQHVLGLATSRAELLVEGLSLVVLLAAVLLTAWRGCSPWARRAAWLVASWAGIGIALPFLPAKVMPAHLMLGTPFHYLAFGFCAIALHEDVRACAPLARARAALFAAALATLVAARLPALVTVEASLLAGESSGRFRPDYTALGVFGATTTPDTAFIASGWGVSLQLYCLANGRADHVFEPFWVYGGPPHLRHILDTHRKRVLYVVRPEPPIDDLTPEATRGIDADAASLPGWRPAPLDAPLARLSALHIRKYVRAP